MRIRHKLLVLLLFFAVVPLLLSIVISHYYFYRSGMHLAEEAERQLSSQAHSALYKLIDSFQRIQERDHQAMEAALDLLTTQGVNSPLASAADPAPPLTYSFLQSYRPGAVSRQYTILESGRSSCYPLHEQCLGSSDPRQLPWYRSTRKLQTQTRTLANDPISGKPVVIIARPLRKADGQFIGVTALVRPLEVMLKDLKLTENWFSGTREMLVATRPVDGTKESGLRILAVRKTSDADTLWRDLHSQSWLQPDRPEDMQLLLQQISTGRGGSLKMGFQGVDAHWIFSSATNSEPFVLILVPHSQVIAQAVAARNHVVDKILKGLGISGGLLICAIAAVFFTAFLASKKVTRPLRTLVAAAEKLAAGDYRSRVTIETEDEVAELGQVFNQLGPALEERQRMASSLALAGDIQRQLLPQTQPLLGGFEIFSGSDPCDETGGDYYDFISLGADDLALAVGDVSGHGIGAALLMAGARGVLRSHAARCELNLPKLFATLNEHLCQDTADEQFMTLFYGVLTANTTTLHWCSAGHGPLFLYRCREKTIIEFGSTGLPLGIIDETAWEQGAPFVFETGDILLVGTDGIWEARNPQGQALGTERLKALIFSRASEPAAQIHAAIMEQVRHFRSDSRQEDDITLTVIKAITT